MKKSTYWKTGIFILFLYGLMRMYFFVTDDFRLSNIQYTMPFKAEWQIPPLSSEEEKQLQEILNIPFYYLGKGAQSYAFASENDRYVIKFFKFKHLRPSWFHKILPSFGFIKTFKETQAQRKRRKLYGVFQGYKLAYDIHKSESGLLFIQLNIEGNPHRQVQVHDKMGLKRTLDLEHISFVLQDKGQTLRAVLSNLLEHGDLNGAEKRIGQIFDLYTTEYEKGIYDHDHGVMYNTGFVGNRPIHLDVGKLGRNDTMKQKETAKEDKRLVSAKMSTWLQKFYPQYDSQLSPFISAKVEE